MNLTHDALYEDFDDVSIRLVYESMLDRNISSCDVDGLTIEEVKNEILSGNRIHRILVNGEVVGIFKPSVVDISCYFEWGLDRKFHYSRIGFIYIDKKHRNKGYASKILEEHVNSRSKYAECCHEDNHASNVILARSLKFHKRAYISRRNAYYNIYVK